MSTAALPRARRLRSSPELRLERRSVLAALEAVVPMLGAMLGSHVEVVLHDLSRPESSVRCIANGHVTGRAPGSPVLGSPGNDKALAILAEGLVDAGPGEHVPVYPYPTVTRDARALSSGTVMFRDAAGCTYAALCINADTGSIEAARALLARLLPQPPRAAEAPTSRAAEAPDMQALMREIIDDAVRRHGKPVAAMERGEKVQAVHAMLQRGLFIVKGGVEHAAAALGVSRFTIYNYLDTLNAAAAGGAADSSMIAAKRMAKPQRAATRSEPPATKRASPRAASPQAGRRRSR